MLPCEQWLLHIPWKSRHPSRVLLSSGVDLGLIMRAELVTQLSSFRGSECFLLVPFTTVPCDKQALTWSLCDRRTWDHQPWKAGGEGLEGFQIRGKNGKHWSERRGTSVLSWWPQKPSVRCKYCLCPTTQPTVTLMASSHVQEPRPLPWPAWAEKGQHCLSKPWEKFQTGSF